MTAHAPITPGASLSISSSTECDGAEWDRFIRAHPDGTFFQLPGWGQAAKRAYGYETYYLTASKNGMLTGVLLLTYARTPLLGASLISTAFSVGGGPLATDVETLQALLDEAMRIGEEKKVRYIECRSDFEADGWLGKSGAHAAFETPLLQKEEDALAAIPRKRRAEIRKAMDAANQGELKIRHDGEPDLFYRLYAKSLHRLGTPVFPQQFLHSLCDVFATNMEISIVEHRDEPVAALLSFYFKDRVLPYYIGATAKAREARAFDYIYWVVMRRAVEKGCAHFDFGRSKIGSGAYAYKKLWGIEPRPLSYRVKLIGADAMPDVNAKNPKFALFAKLWPHLPLPAANRIGPLLAPNFP
ncbi:FemAB family XrtA/PEP-CTERM system-associated protein [Hyphococcus sp.]|uniref:FemAB family XrtA/PEP-CTERM system-associated protein n=1 Tax=Hyphococcus sp. TaxID=2038636 RepID=UPI0035C6FE3A